MIAVEEMSKICPVGLVAILTDPFFAHRLSFLANAETRSPFFSLQSPSQSQLFKARSFSAGSSPTRFHDAAVSIVPHA